MEMKFNEVGYLSVRENHCCDHYEPDDGALVPMRECWCCKWSRFTAENNGLNSESVGVCCYKGNMKEVEVCR